MDEFEARAGAYISQHQMLQKGDTVIVALSGGADSMALFHFLFSVQNVWGLRLRAAHVNHGLRGAAADGDAAFVRAQCAARGVPLDETLLSPPENAGEEWGRQERYAFFARLAQAHGAKVATAHTCSDNAETVLFNLARGSAARGAAGIPPVRGPYVRPLLWAQRADVLAYLARCGVPHVTDATNAGRTMLFNLHTQQWDDELLQIMDIPRELLPQVVDSSQVIGMLDEDILGVPVPVAAMAGDQHAALFGQACFERGMAKNTYGTGCFMLMNAGSEFKLSENGLLTTMAWRLNGKPTYALEGSVFMGGATIQWLRDEMKFVEKASQSEALATSITDNEGVYLVPAFTGLGAPHWSMYARGTLFGMTRGTGHAQIVRAGLESIAYQSNDLFQAMARDLGETPAVLRVDGGATANNFLMQFQADISGVAIQRPAVLETTALGAALLAGLAVGVYDNLAETAHGWHVESKFVPSMDPAQRQQLLHGWKRAVDAVLYWARED